MFLTWGYVAVLVCVVMALLLIGSIRLGQFIKKNELRAHSTTAKKDTHVSSV